MAYRKLSRMVHDSTTDSKHAIAEVATQTSTGTATNSMKGIAAPAQGEHRLLQARTVVRVSHVSPARASTVFSTVPKMATATRLTYLVARSTVEFYAQLGACCVRIVLRCWKSLCVCVFGSPTHCSVHAIEGG